MPHMCRIMYDCDAHHICYVGLYTESNGDIFAAQIVVHVTVVHSLVLLYIGVHWFHYNTE